MKILKILREVYKTTSDLLHVHVHVHVHGHAPWHWRVSSPLLETRANERIALGMLRIRLVQMAVAIAAVAASSQTEQGGPCAGTILPTPHGPHARSRAPTHLRSQAA